MKRKLLFTSLIFTMTLLSVSVSADSIEKTYDPEVINSPLYVEGELLQTLKKVSQLCLCQDLPKGKAIQSLESKEH
jgi:hypothetical protein